MTTPSWPWGALGEAQCYESLTVPMDPLETERVLTQELERKNTELLLWKIDHQAAAKLEWIVRVIFLIAGLAIGLVCASVASNRANVQHDSAFHQNRDL